MIAARRIGTSPIEIPNVPANSGGMAFAFGIFFVVLGAWLSVMALRGKKADASKGWRNPFRNGWAGLAMILGVSSIAFGSFALYTLTWTTP